MVRISLHGRARVNVTQFFSGLVLGVHSQQTFVTVKQVKFLMKFLSCMCIEDVSEVLFLVRLLIRPALKSDQRLGRFDDLLILAAKHAGQNVSAVFWPLYCHTMPPQGNVMGGQVWPQWKSFSCHVSHFRCGGNMHVCGCSVWTCWIRMSSVLPVMRPLLHHTSVRRKAAITSSLGIVMMLPQQPDGDPCYHFPLLDPFVNISVYSWCGGVNIKFCFLYKQARSTTKEVEQVYTQDVCLCPAETVTCPHQVDLTNLCLPAAGLSELCLKTMAPTITVK